MAVALYLDVHVSAAIAAQPNLPDESLARPAV